MKTLLVLNDAPYGSEHTYNGARLAGALARQEGHNKQKMPTGFYILEVMLGSVVNHGGMIGVCGTCMDARGITADDLIAGAHRSTMDELTQWTAWADKALVF